MLIDTIDLVLCSRFELIIEEDGFESIDEECYFFSSDRSV